MTAPPFLAIAIVLGTLALESSVSGLKFDSSPKSKKKNQFLPVSGSVFVCSSFDYRHEREVVAVRDASLVSR